MNKINNDANMKVSAKNYAITYTRNPYSKLLITNFKTLKNRMFNNNNIKQLITRCYLCTRPIQKKYFFILLSIITINVQSQVQELKKYTSISEEQIVFNIVYNSWSKLPDKMQIKPQSLGFDAYYMTPVIGKNKILNLAIGGGVSVQNYKSNVKINSNNDTLSFIVINDSINYTKNKFNTVYFDIPIEFKIRTRPIVKRRSLKFIVGFKLGILIQSYEKYEGDDYMQLTSNDKVKYKVYKINQVLPYRYGSYFRIGYGKFNLTGFLSLSSLFNTKKSLETYPYSLGLSITLF